MTVYEKSIRERFPALVADPIWPTVERLVQEDWRDGDETWFPGLQRFCVELCVRLGLSFEPEPEQELFGQAYSETETSGPSKAHLAGLIKRDVQ